mmetsp:Transcript_6254/g.8224  ORF Transcript_6254/g.8224 Transcript_6254/m.8224 type:complete len:624 (-) Transcript_6254:590-2461(-)
MPYSSVYTSIPLSVQSSSSSLASLHYHCKTNYVPTGARSATESATTVSIVSDDGAIDSFISKNTAATITATSAATAGGLCIAAVSGACATGLILGGIAAGAAIYGISQTFARGRRQQSSVHYVGSVAERREDAMATMTSPGNVIALHSCAHRRFLRMEKGGRRQHWHVNGNGGPKDAEYLPSNWDTELFTVVGCNTGDHDYGGEIALRNHKHGRFMRVCGTSVDGDGCDSSKMDKKEMLPDDCISERFMIVDAGGGSVAIQSARHDCFIRMDQKGAVKAVTSSGQRVHEWERFTVVRMNGGDILRPGSVVALYNTASRRFISCNAHNKDTTAPDERRQNKRREHFDFSRLPAVCHSERLTIVNAGKEEISLYSASHHCFVRVEGNRVVFADDTSTSTNNSENKAPEAVAAHHQRVHPFPRNDAERFYLTNTEDGTVALYAKSAKTFLQMDPTNGTLHVRRGVLECNGGHHTFRVLRLVAHTLLQPGAIVALHSFAHNRLVSFVIPGDQQQQQESEYYEVVDAGEGKIGLYSIFHGSFVCMKKAARVQIGKAKAVKEGPSFGETFVVVDAGDGIIALYSKHHRRFIRMNSLGRLDGGPRWGGNRRNEDSLPDDWSWERFYVVAF